MISASALARIEKCPASESLPHTQQENEWQGPGLAKHKYVEVAMPDGPEAGLLAIPEKYRDECRNISTQEFIDFFGEAPRHEVSYALDVETGEARELGEGLGRAYPKVNSTTIVGTADMVLVDYERSRVMVSDMKTGRAWLPDAKDSVQLGFFAVALARVVGAKQARVAYHKLNADGSWYEMADDYDEIDLDGMFARLRDIVTATQTHSQPSLGDHCAFCPARLACPAQANVMQQMVPLVDRLPEINAEMAWDLHEWLPHAKKQVKLLDDALKDYVLHNPGAKRDGMELRMVRTEKEKVITKTALQVFLNQYGVDALMDAVSTSKSALQKAVPATAPRGAKKGNIEDIQ